MEHMAQTVAQLAEERFGAPPICPPKPLGGGFYGRVFLCELPVPPYRVVFKLYLFPGIAEREALQLRTLATYATLAVPEVFFVQLAADEAGHDALAMQFIPGRNAGERENRPEPVRRAIGEEIVRNLIAFHDATHAAGFGELDARRFMPDWRVYYRPIAEATFAKAKALRDAGELPPETLCVMERAMERYDRVFDLPITTARLIHGDYNTWNILLTEDGQRAKAVIDPFHCCWADSELELYQLDNANGKEYGLLTLYQRQRPLSENYPVKRAFYELFTEAAHYYDAKVDASRSALPAQADALAEAMRRYGAW